ncbi:MAG: hypothetical protein JKY47_02140 [Thalassospira sp.]|nr:hypothetical protein [Thalassospira sp.]
MATGEVVAAQRPARFQAVFAASAGSGAKIRAPAATAAEIPRIDFRNMEYSFITGILDNAAV